MRLEVDAGLCDTEFGLLKDVSMYKEVARECSASEESYLAA